MANPEIDQMIQYTKQFIEAAAPVAKQAYEIGLVTLRIDAAQTIVFALLALAVSALVIKKILGDYKEAKRVAALPENQRSMLTKGADDHLPAGGVFHFIGGVLAALSGGGAVIALANVWVWVELFAPQLWLAHMAVQKIIG